MTALAYYLLKVIICSGVLLLYYQVALKNRIFHHWNRFYLLATVVLSLLLPLVQIMIWHTTDDSEAVRLILYMQSADNYLQEITVTTGTAISFSEWMLMGYCLICVLLLYSLAASLLKVLKIIRTNTLQLFRNIKFINTKEPGTPFSFLDFIIWNEEISLQSETGQQIFQHELVHVKEKHTVDKLFMQIVLAIFWANPFFWLIRRELKFIHEFIADKKAVGTNGTEAFAAMVLQTAYPQHYHSITNQFFQTSIKRRLLMLTKIQNKKLNYLSRLIALPLVAITIFAFTVRTRSAAVENKVAASVTSGRETQRISVDGNDTFPKSKKEIATIDVKKEKEINTITIGYKDGTSETLTEKEANSRGLIHQGGFGTQKRDVAQTKKTGLTINSGSTQPLYIVDGKEMKDFDPSKIDAKMIQSINVLKDKTATDKYGIKGKNGVIEIMTKKIKTDEQIIIQEDGKKIGEGTFEISKEQSNISGGTKYFDPEDVKKMTIHQLAGVEKSDEIIFVSFAINKDNGDLLQSTNKGNSFSEASKNLINTASTGKALTVQSILIKRNGEEKKIPAKIYMM